MEQIGQVQWSVQPSFSLATAQSHRKEKRVVEFLHKCKRFTTLLPWRPFPCYHLRLRVIAVSRRNVHTRTIVCCFASSSCSKERKPNTTQLLLFPVNHLDAMMASFVQSPRLVLPAILFCYFDSTKPYKAIFFKQISTKLKIPIWTRKMSTIFMVSWEVTSLPQCLARNIPLLDSQFCKTDVPSNLWGPTTPVGSDETRG